MNRLDKLKTSVIVIIILSASIVYGAIIAETAKTNYDLTIPLIFNGVVPSVVIAYYWRKREDKIDSNIVTLNDCAKNHESRIGKIETTHELRGCGSPDSAPAYKRRKDDNI